MKQIITAILVACAINASAQQQPKQEEPKQDTSNYVLIGKLPYFELMYRAVNSPGDVTPNQKAEVLRWMQTLQAIKPQSDSTKTQKPKK